MDSASHWEEMEQLQEVLSPTILPHKVNVFSYFLQAIHYLFMYYDPQIYNISEKFKTDI